MIQRFMDRYGESLAIWDLTCHPTQVNGPPP